MMSGIRNAHGAPWGNEQSMCQHRIFFILDLCDAIGQLGVFSVRENASKTPKWVGLGAEQADTDGFGVQNEGGVLAGSGPGDGGLGVRKVEKVGKCSKNI